MKESNHQVVFVEQGIARLEPCPVPVPGPNQVLIRTRVSLISPGTERAWLLGLPNTPGIYPQRAGYSNIGQVVACGANVAGWQPGQRVASPAPHARLVAMDAARCIPVPDSLSDEEAVFFNLGAIATQGVRKARIELGEPVAVLGAGLIGLLAVQLSRLSGAIPAVIIDQIPQRLEFARQVGADANLVPGQDLEERLAALCDGSGAAAVIEATGSPQAILTALAIARPFGRVVLLGSTRGETDHVNFYRDVHKKGLSLIGAHDSTRPSHDSAPHWWTRQDDQRAALKLLAARRLQVLPLITHRFSWDEAEQAYALLTQWDLNALGILLKW